MSGPLDDNAFEDYLQRGSAVSQSYRALDAEEVPPQLDAAVLARASAAVSSAKSERASTWRRWSVPVALAASSVLAVSIVLESGGRHEVLSTQELAAQTDNYAVGAAAPAQGSVQEAEIASDMAVSQDVASAAPMPVQPRADARAVELPQSIEKKESAVPTRPARAAAPVAARPTEERQAFAVRRELQSARQQEAEAEAVAAVQAARQRAAVSAHAERAAPMSSVPPPPAAAEAAPLAELDAVAAMIASPAPPVTPEAPEPWLQRIRDLRSAGEYEKADREWTAFRERYPDFHIADDDTARPPVKQAH